MFIQTLYILVALYMVGDEPIDHKIYGQYLEASTCEHMATHLVDVHNDPSVGQKFIDAGVESVKVLCVEKEVAEWKES